MTARAGQIVERPPFEFPMTEVPRGPAHWLLRLTVAGFYLYHGLQHMADHTQFATEMSVSPDMMLAVAIAECLGAALVLLGGLSRGLFGDMCTRGGTLVLLPVAAGALAIFALAPEDAPRLIAKLLENAELTGPLLASHLYLLLRGRRA